jgi:hypothetical protein
MRAQRLGSLFIALTPVYCAPAWAQLGAGFSHDAGQSITAAYEGWFSNDDGTSSILIGYFNRNTKQVLDIPIGPNNHIDPGGPDRGQPTHFIPGRGWGMFTVTVPKDFGANEITWTIVANGQTTVIPFGLNPLWVIAPYIDAIKNTPPFLSFQPFDEAGPTIQGPRPLVVSRTATVGVPLPLTVFVADDNVYSPGRNAPKNPITVTWTYLRGPAEVAFSPDKPPVEKTEGKIPKGAVVAGKASTSATFAEPGEYTLYVAINDASGVGGGGGFQCCWTNGHVKVDVKPSSTASR